MAFVELSPISFNATIYGGLQQQLKTPVMKDAAAAVIDFTTWDTIVAEVKNNPAPVVAQTPLAFGSCTGNADGTIELNVSPIGDADLLAGQCRLTLKGKKASGDEFQVLSNGTLTVVK